MTSARHRLASLRLSSSLSRVASRPRRGPCRRGPEADEDQLGIEVARARERVCRLERGDDPLRSREVGEGGSASSSVAAVLGAAGVAQERVLGTDARIVEPGGDRVGVRDLAVLVREDRRARAVQHARAAARRAIAAPAASTPIDRTPTSSTKPRKMPIAFEPPPTHATTASGSPPSAARICSRASRPITTAAPQRARGTAPGRRTSRSGSASSRRS